jgi:hypothetical protein
VTAQRADGVTARLVERVRLLHADAPPQRLAALRILVGTFAVVYLLVRLPVFSGLDDRDDATYRGIGVLAWFPDPLPPALVTTLLIVALISGGAFIAGAMFRLSGPTFAVAMLVLTTIRSSGGQLLHFENLVVLHLLIVGVAGAADAWSIDDHLRARRAEARRRTADYRWPLICACLVMVISYVIAGIAKLRYGGLDWVIGDSLRNHVAYSAARLDLLGGTPSPVARWVVGETWLFRPMAAASVLIELAAPVALLGGWVRNGWVAMAWLMHASIAALMFVVFPYPLWLVAFAPLFALERLDPRE